MNKAIPMMLTSAMGLMILAGGCLSVYIPARLTLRGVEGLDHIEAAPHWQAALGGQVSQGGRGRPLSHLRRLRE